MTSAENGFVPFRRRAVALTNRVGATLSQRGIAPDLSADRLRRRAVRATGLPWAADLQTDEALEVLCGSIIDEANLSTFGALVIRARMHASCRRVCASASSSMIIQRSPICRSNRRS